MKNRSRKKRWISKTVWCQKHDWMTCALKNKTRGITRTTHPFFTMLWGTTDQVVWLEWLSNSRQKGVVKRTKKEKVRQT
jgi:hypothetical protein